MRALNVVGLTDSGSHLVCEAENGERFELAAAQLSVAATAYRERQRQAAEAVRAQRAQLAEQTEQELREQRARDAALRDRQVEERRTRPVTGYTRPPAPAQPTLRPKDIQNRIRLGASLDEVAREAGCDPSRIELFAFPVLMERAAVAERAQKATPVVDGQPMRGSVSELATKVLEERGQAESARWDAHRTEDGGWVLRLTWLVGRSENSASWSFHQSGGGAKGTLIPLGDDAVTLLDPSPRPLRTVPETTVEEPAPPLNPLVIQTSPAVPGQHVSPTPGLFDQVVAPSSAPPDSAAPARTAPLTMSSSARRPAGNKVAAAMVNHAVQPAATAAPAPVPSAASSSSAPAASASAAARSVTRGSVARTGTDDGRSARPGRPPMPSWEDVLLGVRSKES